MLDKSQRSTHVHAKTIRVVLAEDHHLVRAGIYSLLQSHDDIEIVAQAADGTEALRAIQEHQPDVAVLDVRMPEMNGLETLECISKKCPAVRTVMLSMHADEEYVLHAMRAGAMGYVLKDATPEELAQAVQAVARGGVYLSQQVAGHVTADYARQINGRSTASSSSGGAAPDPLDLLTPRQREILILIAEGHSTKDIGAKLFISPKTVETHRLQLMERLGIFDIAGLVRYAIQRKLVTLDE